jgi:hypothetical protein
LPSVEAPKPPNIPPPEPPKPAVPPPPSDTVQSVQPASHETTVATVEPSQQAVTHAHVSIGSAAELVRSPSLQSIKSVHSTQLLHSAN